ncbi:RNA 3'-terminal phosphate cyclase [Candidatus Nitrospira bockiana]
MSLIHIDGSRYSGSGTIVRQSVLFAALTGQALRITNARLRRPNPGLRPQHIQVITAIAALTGAETEGLVPGSQDVVFAPRRLDVQQEYEWDIGTAGSTTMLALAVLPLLAFARKTVTAVLTGGLFQDFAPSVFHLEYVMLPLLERMGLHATAEVVRPGYVPRGEGVLRLVVQPVGAPLSGLLLDAPGPVKRVWGIALSSHLEARRVSARMAEAAGVVLGARGIHADIELRHDRHARQAGAALALFADFAETRLGADQAGALGRPAETIGMHVATQLLADMDSQATVDRFAADQIIPFAALASGETRVRIPAVTDHVETNLWLAETLLGAHVQREARELCITGIGLVRQPTADSKVQRS